MSKSGGVKRSRTRRAGENAYGVLLLAKSALMVLIALLLLCAGVWTSWGTARPAMTGSERGTVRVERCGEDVCTGTFTPADSHRDVRERVTVAKTVSGKTGETLDVAVRPGTDEVVRTGPAGILYAWVPFGGALLLASLVVAGGLRMRRTALALGVLGAATTAGAWALLTF
ncbi:hypothetical protein [Streptomyces daliensis]|uniref:Uncharacterized protein n=1 Tax=Streptomyces daliensis TaxID=299421 RepID=A0A8T4J202_9ACTN|nr:hypothetical protein [Streptomyces daliensis]